MLEMRISKLKNQIANARIIDPALLDNSKVSILSSVKIKNLANGMEMSYQLVPETEADLSRGKISVNTPIAKDRKSTRLNSSHVAISYAVFCLRNKKQVLTARQNVRYVDRS